LQKFIKFLHANLFFYFLNFFFFFFFLVGLGFELKAFYLQTRCSTSLAILEMGGLTTLYLSWLQTSTLPISACQEARIIGRHKPLAPSQDFQLCRNRTKFKFFLVTIIVTFSPLMKNIIFV
jgi:hypothetical protein